MKKIAVCLNTHFLNGEIYNRFNTLKENVSPGFDFYIVCNNELKVDNNLEIKDNIFYYSSKDLRDCGYKLISPVPIFHRAKSVMWVNGSLMPINLFHKIKPEYDYYWSIEYDVIFNGEWKYFFETAHKEDWDFCTSHIKKADKSWWWYDDILIPYNAVKIWRVDEPKRYQSLNTICAFSNEFLKYLNKLYLVGYFGNCEQTLPTAAVNNNMKMVDLAQLGLCTFESNNWQKYYKNIDIKNLIYHPVK